MQTSEMEKAFADFVASDGQQEAAESTGKRVARIIDAGSYRGSVHSYQLKNVSSLKKDGSRNPWAAHDVYRVRFDVNTGQEVVPLWCDVSTGMVKNKIGSYLEPTMLARMICRLSELLDLPKALDRLIDVNLDLKVSVSQATEKYPSRNWLTIVGLSR